VGERAELQPGAEVAAQAALRQQLSPAATEFTATKQAVEASWQALSGAEEAGQLALGEYLLKEVSKQRVGDRPDRCEPRAVKRRPKPHRLLMKPRAEARAVPAVLRLQATGRASARGFINKRWGFGRRFTARGSQRSAVAHPLLRHFLEEILPNANCPASSAPLSACHDASTACLVAVKLSCRG